MIIWNVAIKWNHKKAHFARQLRLFPWKCKESKSYKIAYIATQGELGDTKKVTERFGWIYFPYFPNPPIHKTVLGKIEVTNFENHIYEKTMNTLPSIRLAIKMTCHWHKRTVFLEIKNSHSWI